MQYSPCRQFRWGLSCVAWLLYAGGLLGGECQGNDLRLATPSGSSGHANRDGAEVRGGADEHQQVTAKRWQGEGSGDVEQFDPVTLIPRPFPVIDEVPLLEAAEVNDQIAENELVIGVVVAGEARAYPVNMLTGPRREIINDVLGGQAIAATW